MPPGLTTMSSRTLPRILFLTSQVGFLSPWKRSYGYFALDSSFHFNLLMRMRSLVYLKVYDMVRHVTKLEFFENSTFHLGFSQIQGFLVPYSKHIWTWNFVPYCSTRYNLYRLAWHLLIKRIGMVSDSKQTTPHCLWLVWNTRNRTSICLTP